MRRVVAGLVAAMCAGLVPAIGAPAQPRLTIDHLAAPGTGIAQTLLPVLVDFNQPVVQRKVRVQRLAAGRWIVSDEVRVTGPQVSVPVRLPQAGVQRLRLLVLDPGGPRWVVSPTFTVRVTRAALPMILVDLCDGTLSAAHDGRRLWTLCARPGGANLNDGGRHDIGAATAFVARDRQLWMLRDTDVLPLDTTADELLRPIPVVGAPDERAGLIASGPSGVWVAVGRLTQSVGGPQLEEAIVRIDPVEDTVTARIPLPVSLPGQSTRRVLVGARNVWVTRSSFDDLDGRNVTEYLRVNPDTKVVTRFAGGDTAGASGLAGIWSLRLVGGSLRRIDPVPTSFRDDVSRLSIRSLTVGRNTLWGLTFRPTGPPRALVRYLVARLDPRTGRMVGRLRGVGPWVNPFAEVKVVMIGDHPWVLFQRLGVLMRVP